MFTIEEMNEKLNKIHCINCLNFMKQVPDNYFDCIFSDVPYLISKGGSTKVKGAMSWNYKEEKRNGKIFKHNDITEQEYIEPMYRILKDGGHIYIMTNNRHLANIQKEMEKHGFIINNILVMIKENTVVNQHYIKNCEFTIFARKGKSKGLKDFSINSAIQVSKKDEGIYHDSQKPIEYVKKLIWNSTQDNGKVFDTFIGSGTTAIACKSLGLNFVGCELDPKYVAIANKRLEQVQGSLF